MEFRFDIKHDKMVILAFILAWDVEKTQYHGTNKDLSLPVKDNIVGLRKSISNNEKWEINYTVIICLS